MTVPQFANSAASAAFIICIITAPLSILAVILRSWAAVRTGRKHSTEDWLSYAAVAVHLAYISSALKSLEVIDGRPIFLLDLPDILYVSKLAYATAPLFTLNQVATKGSILFMYYRIFGVNRVFAYWIFFTGALVVAWFIATVPLYLFACKPISRGWNPLVPGECLDNPPTVMGAEVINSGIDFVLVVLAWFMIRPLRTSTATKLQLAVIFAVAGLAGVLGIVKIVETYNFDTNEGINYITSLWAIVQMAASIFCCCSATWTPILPKAEYLKRLTSSIVSLLSLSKTDNNSAKLVNASRRNGSASTRETPSAGQSWTKLEDGNQERMAAWTEVSSGQRMDGVHEVDLQLKAINIQHSVNVAKV